jgi:hypothetical protein
MRLFRSAPARAALLASSTLVVSSLVPADAGAVVEQTDGLVVPVQVMNCPGSGNPNGCIQVALNIGEGLAPTAQNNPLNAVFDAVTSPEIFAIPKNNGAFGTVTVQDLIEGAGYENSFGWYNVSNPSALYVITPCTDEPGSSRTVDFQNEFVQGRYLGGFIGFFLITPEGQPNPNNCGSIGNVGHQYYTEQAKNGDGNYVHYLLYQSKVNPLAFYFGFEDLYRGGDNDFEDMFLKVTGLLAPCSPSPEVCDNMDNNCDGLVDNTPVDAGGACGPTDAGECSFGVVACQSGVLVCNGYQGPSPELCDGLDNDCDGVIDDAPAGEGGSCGVDTGECSFGTQQCIGGVFVCVGKKGPSLETCNTLDDDCNGAVDDSTIDAGGPCGSNVGVCNPGVLTCVNGAIECVGGTMGSAEVCNSLDDDCNGAIDDGDPGGGAACGPDTGVCDPGVEHCVGGQVVCIGGVGPSAEICDGLDNDCDGMGDNLAPCPDGSKCVQGSCAEPCGSGEFACPGGQICVDNYCLPATCDNVMCPEGQMCVQGICVKNGAGGMGGGGGMGTGGMGGGAGGGMSAGGGGTGGGGAGAGGETNGGAWGLPSGGGGTSCAVSGSAGLAGSAGLLAAWGAALGGLGLALRRIFGSNGSNRSNGSPRSRAKDANRKRRSAPRAGQGGRTL